MPVFRLSHDLDFPSPNLAAEGGFLAVGGDLSVDRLLSAYKSGIFPWYTEGEPILWWSPDPRLVLFPDAFHISRSLEKIMRRNTYSVSFDRDFQAVIRHCADVRGRGRENTWITDDMRAAYTDLHHAGFAHSVEVRDQGKQLVGGLYGVSLGRAFFGESMFSIRSNTSKIALATLVRRLRARKYHFIDCQVSSDHLRRLGARDISRTGFLRLLKEAMKHPTDRGKWHGVTEKTNDK